MSDDADFLIERYLAGQLTPDEAERLLQLLQAKPQLGQGLLDQLSTNAMLRDIARADRTSATVPAAPVLVSRPNRWIRWGAALAASLLLVGIVWTIARRDIGTRDSSESASEATTTAVAVLTRTVNAQWAEGADAPRPGSLLVPGELKLQAGLAQIEFFSGASVVLEGPAEFRLISTNEGFCQRGRMTAEVPPQAQGFRVGTPQQDIVDRGTAFGLEVRETAAEVHVFKGKVELHEKDTKAEDLNEGEATAVEGGKRRRVAANAAAFVSAAELDQRLAAAERKWCDGWQTSAAKINADPSLIARFDFETDAGGRSLRNVAKSERGVRDGSIVGCGWVDGRWPGKHALEFRGVGDRVRVNLPGEFRSLTFAAWVRVNGVDRRFNSLLLTDGFEVGAVHWQIQSNGRIRLGVRGVGQGTHRDYDSPPVFTPERFGQWMHIAVTYDAAGKRATHYVDGKVVSRETTTVETPLRIGLAEIGNWTPGIRRYSTPIRNFSGRIDELSVYDRALSDAEIVDLHRSGAGWDETR
jgi:ferric-dicitrate binding protein FerR (iron transport regulator)